MFTISDQRKQALAEVTGFKPKQYGCSKQRKMLDGSSGSGKGGMDWTDLAEDTNRWWALVNAVMNLHISYNAVNLST